MTWQDDNSCMGRMLLRSSIAQGKMMNTMNGRSGQNDAKQSDKSCALFCPRDYTYSPVVCFFGLCPFYTCFTILHFAFLTWSLAPHPPLFCSLPLSLSRALVSLLIYSYHGFLGHCILNIHNKPSTILTCALVLDSPVMHPPIPPSLFLCSSLSKFYV